MGTYAPTLLLVIAVLASPVAGAAAASDGSALLSGFTVENGRATFTLCAPACSIVAGEDGDRVEIDGFHRLLDPGRPYLPVKRFLVALPPGARALSVRVLSSRSTTLPGSHAIEPSPPPLPLVPPERFDGAMEKMRAEWRANRDASYRSDDACPERIAWLDGAGSFRRYSYASVAFAPVTCHPLSGTLDYHDEVEVAVEFAVDEESREAAMRGGPSDDAAEAKAERLFDNFDDVARHYAAAESREARKSSLHDYVVVTTSSNLAGVTASAFTAWKTALGFQVRTVLVTDVEIASQPGADLAERIRNFLRQYYQPWGIDYVLLVGNYLSVPMRVCYPDPAFHVYNPDDPGLVAPGTPTDAYYADLSLPDSLSWDADGDGFPGEHGEDAPDFLAEVAVGRVPVNNNDRITYALDKIVAFEQDGGSWKSSALHAGAILFFENQNFSGVPFVDGATLLDSIQTALMGGFTMGRMCECEGLVTSSFPWGAMSESAFSSEWSAGQYGYVNWSGHGWCNGAARTVWYWDDGDGVPETDGSDGMSSLYFINEASTGLEDDHPSVVFAVSCNVGYPEPNVYGRAGVDLLTRPGWGAAAGIVCSARPAAVSKDWIGDPGGTESICYEFNRCMIAEEERIGDALCDGKFHAHTEYGWNTVYEPMNLYNFNLFGDPSMLTGSVATGVADAREVDVGLPLSLSTVEPNPFRSATTIRFAGAAGRDARLAVYDIRGRRVADLRAAPEGNGRFAATWNGTDRDGRKLPSGIYFVALASGSEREARKVVLLR